MSSPPLVAGTLPERTPNYPLFDSNAVGLATFFGSPVMGGSLMAWNYRRLGQTGKAVLTFSLAVAVTTLVILATWNLNRGATGVLGLVLFIAMQSLAKALQGKAVAHHVQEGGALGSKWTAFWLGIAFLVVLFCVAFAYEVATTDRNSVTIGTRDKVFYEGTATKEDALAVGKALKAGGFLTDRGVALIVAKEKDGPSISIPLRDGLWNQPNAVSSYEEVGREMAPLLGGYPIKVRLLDTSRALKKEMIVGRAEFPGNDDVFYQGGVTQSQAQAVGEALKTAGFFEGGGSDVFVAKDGGITTIGFVTNSKAWSDPGIQGAFEKIARAAAPSLGGLPVHLQFVDNTLVLKKDIALN
jgi:hypothetical protein